MADMPRPRPPYLHCERTRHGKIVWYVRIRGNPRVRIRAAWGTEEFNAEYKSAIDGTPISKEKAKSTGTGTLAWAEKLYRQSNVWAELSPATRRQRGNILKKVVETAGSVRLADISRKKIIEGRERRAATPGAARNFVETMRGFFAWAVDNELVEIDPTKDVKSPRQIGKGFPVWSEDDIAAFEAYWPIGTRERLAFDLLLETGLRRGDAVVLGRQHIRDGVARIATEKTGERVAIPISERLAKTLAAGPCGDLAFICCVGGAPMTKESFGNFFRAACRAAGISKSAHGIRKAAATRAANAGFSEAQLLARFGWASGRMAGLYTKTMDRERLSLDAQDKLEPRTSIPAPKEKVRARKEKD